VEQLHFAWLCGASSPSNVVFQLKLVACRRRCHFRRHAVKLFPLDAIWVCDNSSAPEPVDDTQDVCRRISREVDPSGTTEINYSYVCQGNKTLALYWVLTKWMPAQLSRRARLGRRQCGADKLRTPPTIPNVSSSSSLSSASFSPVVASRVDSYTDFLHTEAEQGGCALPEPVAADSDSELAMGAKLAAELFPYVIIIDDDVPLPADLAVPLDEFDRDDDVQAAAFVIGAAKTERCESPLLVDLQNAEYKLSVSGCARHGV
jgi:hypothetical protein